MWRCIAAAEALGRLRDPHAVDALLTPLCSVTERLRRHNETYTWRNQSFFAQTASLGEEDEEANLFAEMPYHDETKQALTLARACIASLGAIGCQQATKPLCTILQDEPHLAGPLIRALEAIGDPEALPTLLSAFDSVPGHEGLLIEAICTIVRKHPSSDALTEIEAAVSQASASIRVGALQILARRASPIATSTLLTLIGDGHPRVRATALALTCDPGTQGEVLFPHLLALLHDPHEQVRLQVVDAMAILVKGG